MTGSFFLFWKIETSTVSARRTRSLDTRDIPLRTLVQVIRTSFSPSCLSIQISGDGSKHTLDCLAPFFYRTLQRQPLLRVNCQHADDLPTIYVSGTLLNVWLSRDLPELLHPKCLRRV